MKFKINTNYKPSGSQPNAINELVKGLNKGLNKQTLLGVTGSGKTFTIANVIEKIQKPTLIIAHNKTLAAQLCQEFRNFFPDNAVEYFVSYYDYYQPEAYLPNSDTYIEKDADINEEIEKLRHGATASLLSRNDVIIVATVSCIYGLGSPIEYDKNILYFKLNDNIDRNNLNEKLVNMYYVRNLNMQRGTYRLIGENFEIVLPGEDRIIQLKINSSKLNEIVIIDKLTRNILSKPNRIFLPPAKHFVVSNDILSSAIANIKKELKNRVKYFLQNNKITEAERLERKTNYDLELIKEIGYCKGIENYSFYLSGRKKDEPPYTLLDFFSYNKNNNQKDFLTVIDESHVTIPQLNAMYAGDRSRKKTLIEYGFRLPSALDNRPLKFEEFEKKIQKTIYMSATPGLYEKNNSKKIVEQIIRPTGLIDPQIIIKPITNNKKQSFEGQVTDVITEIRNETSKKNRVLVTTLTKKMSEDLSKFLIDQKIKAKYLHSNVSTLDRVRILQDLRKGKFDCLVGVNLLREGLDLPEVSLVAILDADKEGFLRSETSLIQTIGRAARNITGKVILYADNITGSIERAIRETNRRRKIQKEYNKKHHITPSSIKKKIENFTEEIEPIKEYNELMEFEKIPEVIKQKEREMKKLAKDLRFEEATLLRDEIKQLKKISK